MPRNWAWKPFAQEGEAELLLFSHVLPHEEGNVRLARLCPDLSFLPFPKDHMDTTQKDEPNAVAEHSDGQPAEQSSRKPQTMVVGIGASAGGLAALQAFFEAVAPDLGVAFVVIIHLHPAHRSELATILQAHTAMPVVQVTATVGLEPNHVYVIPPNQQLFATDH